MALIAGTSIPGSAATALAWTAAAGGGDTVAYNPAKKQIILFNNAGTSKTITLTAARTTAPVGRDVAALADGSVGVGTGVIRAIPVTLAYVNVNGLVNLSYTAVTSLTVAVVEI